MASSIRYLIYGRVQGVAYRVFARDAARELGVRGWVRNLPDGAVECVVAAGQPGLEEFEARLAKGPRWGRVKKLEKQKSGERVDSRQFRIVR